MAQMVDEMTATPELRWRLNPTPDCSPTLQQKWIGVYDCDAECAPEEWRDVPGVWD